MADTAVAITAGTGTNIDTRTEATNGNHRQVIVIGDPSTNAGVAPVDATTGLAVNVTNASLTVGTHAVTQSGTWTVQPGNTANTTAWKVDGSAVTQPVSLTSTTITGTVAVTESGTWTVQPGNTPNTVPWLTKIHDGTTAALVKAASSGAAAASDPALVVTLRDVNANGQTTMSASAPVTIASDQSVLTTQLASSSNIVSGAITTAMTGTTSTSLVAAPGASLRNYITTIIVSNAHATVGTDVIIQDGSGGTTLLTIPAAAVYGGGVISLPVPLRQPTTNTALYCANVTTGASTKVSAVGFKGA